MKSVPAMSTDHETHRSEPSPSEAQRQREALRSLHVDVLDEPVPAAMLETIGRARSAREQQARWWRWGGMAAGLLLAFGAGWQMHGLTGPRGTHALVDSGPLAFARQAAVAHAVYATEQRHPVEVSAAEQAHLVQWLSRRLGTTLKTPVLAEEGFELMGGRLLPGGAGARAQFMYQGPGQERLTLYVGALSPSSGDGQQTAETAFRFTDEGPVPGFYWMDQGFGYALSGPLPRDQLARLARLVYQQL